MNLDKIEEALMVNLSFKLISIMNKQSESKNKISKKDFTNSRYALDIVKISNAHIRYVTFWFFKDLVESNKVKCQNLKENLKNLCMLYGLN